MAETITKIDDTHVKVEAEEKAFEIYDVVEIDNRIKSLEFRLNRWKSFKEKLK